MFQGLGYSPIKVVCELGLECHETVWSISGVGVRALKGPFPNMRGLGRMSCLLIVCHVSLLTMFINHTMR